MEIAIRQFQEADAKPFQEAVLESVEHLSEWMAWCTPQYSIDDAKEWATAAAASWESGTDYRFVIEDTSQGIILGCVGINQIVTQHKIGNLGYWVRKSALNKGICTQAAKMAISFAFQKLGFQRIEVHVHPGNTASNLVASRLGGVYEGMFRNKLILHGNSVPAEFYSIIPSDYET